ncbi:MAG: secretin N-terminal domain-containing protein [Pirellulaceae bacterium]
MLSSLCLAVAAFAWSCTALAQSNGKAEYEVYPCRHKPVRAVESLLADLLPNDANVHLVVDEKSNSLLLRGPATVQQLAKALLEQVDRATVADRPTDSPAVVKAYNVPASDLDRWSGAIRALCGQQSDVRITASREASQIIVLAPPELHAAIAIRLTQGLSPSAAAEASGRPGTAQPPNADVERVLPLRALDPEGMEQRLIALFGRRLRIAQRNSIDVFVLPVEPPRALEFYVDRERRIVRARGPEPLVAQFAQLVDALDAGSQPGQRTRALHVERAAPDQLQEAVDAYRGKVPTTPSAGPQAGDQSHKVPAPVGNPVRLVNYLQQTVPDGGDTPLVPGGVTDELGTVVPNVPGLNDLEVQTLPDLDVIILRGRDQDVEQLTRIIRELERLSAETQPRIFIYPLKYTLGASLVQIIEEVQPDLVGRRQGRVTVTPLVKPNALLLIGWGEAVESIIELISKLDQPVSPESQFSVFSLKHAVATTVQQTIQQFFGARSGLGPDVQTAVDTRTNTLVVYASPRDMAEVQRLVEELDVAQSGAVNRAQIFEIQNALAADVADTLEQMITAAQAGATGRSAVLELLSVDERGQEIVRSGMLGEIRITPSPRNNTLIVTGPRDVMPLIQAFIDQLDQPGDRAQIKVFRIINGDATNLVTMLRSLMPSQVGQELGPQLPTDPEEESLVPLRFSVEVRSNSIIAIGSEGDLRIVEALLNRLDQSESMNRKNAIYMLKNSPAIDVAMSINQFLQSQRQLEAAQPGQSNPFQDLEREVIVVPEPVGNRLIVSATPRYFDEITQLIEKLDEPPPQVVIQVLIAEITLGDRDELGVELGLQDSVLFDRSLLGDLVTTTNTTQVSDPSGILTSTQEFIRAATNTPGFDFNNRPLGNSGATSSLDSGKTFGGQALSNFSLGRMNDDAGFGGMVLSASSQNISILIRALQETRKMQILSRPLVRTLDNQPAFIQVGQRVPRITGSTVGINGQTNSISLENVGLILGVTPRISPDGNVVMEIDAEKSKVGPEAEGIPVAVSAEGTIIRSPRVDTVTAQATVSVADGETVVLGGMISTEEETIERRAPFLSDIPVLGYLFRYDSRTKRRGEMLIILTPHVIRTREDGERIKQAEFARMNWCAADVYDIYGDAGMNFQTSLSLPTDDFHTEIIYPHQNPRGESTGPPTEVELGPYPQTLPEPAGPAGAPGPLPTNPLQPPLYGPQTPNSWNDPRR